MNTWTMHDKEFRTVTELPPTRRYDYFIKRVADWETVWSLGTDTGWVQCGDAQGREVVPVWPHPRYAAACAVEEWAGNEPRPIELSAWLERWIPGLLQDGCLIAVFPTLNDQGIVLSPDQLERDLEEELTLYESPES